jgi:aminopeptidase-like protein
MEKWWHLLERLFPVYRTLMGVGFERSLEIISEEIGSIQTHHIPTGTQVGSWTVPEEWSVESAWIEDEGGNRLIDFEDDPFCLWQYSTSTDEWISHDDLMNRLAIGLGKGIPLVVTYYKKRWGFSVSEDHLARFNSEKYRVVVNTTFESGNLTLGEWVLPGKSDEEVWIDAVLSCNSLGNNLSGVIGAAYLADQIRNLEDRHYTYRIWFTPETLGPIALFHHLKPDTNRVAGGFNLINLADNNPIQFKESRNSTLIDQAISYCLLQENPLADVNEYDVLTGTCGNEKAYNSLGIEIPLGAIRRSQLCSYPEYDTSADDLDFISKKQLFNSLKFLDQVIQTIEWNKVYQHQFVGEPFLTGYGLFLKIEKDEDRVPYDYLMGFTDGSHSLIDLAEKSGLPLRKFMEACALMEEKDLIKPI